MTQPRLLPRPRALLLDFGGVIVETEKVPDWERALAARIAEVLAAAGAPALDPARIVADIAAGCLADKHWKNAMSRPFAPRELDQEEFWSDFVAADWPVAARVAVTRQARELCRTMGHLRSRRTLRHGLVALLDACDRTAVPVGIVSNALAGQVHLDFLEEHGLRHRFAVEIHSDAVRVRKPNPEMIWLATRALGVDPSEAWYVGDNFDRDVLCGRRAGIGAAILMEAKGTYDKPYELKDIAPDAVVADPAGLAVLFEAACHGAAHDAA
jgi:HAD superfamily hydrolase (TIGR01549 family)